MNLGCLRDPPGSELGEPIAGLLGYAEAYPPAWDNTPRLRKRVIQRGNSCVAAAIHHCLDLAGAPPHSWPATYGMARDDGSDRLPDVGSYLARGVDAVSEWGIVSMSRWPEDSDLESPVPIDVREAGRIATVSGVYRIAETGPRRVARVKDAISQGHGILIGYTKPKWLGQGHAVCLVGYNPSHVWAVNSWPLEDVATFTCDEIAYGDVWGFYVFTIGPKEVR